MAAPTPFRDPTAVVGLRIGAFAIDLALLFAILMLVIAPAFNRIAETFSASDYRCTQRTFDTGPTDREPIGDTTEDLCVRIGDEIKVVRGDDATRFALQFYGLVALLGIANNVLLQGIVGASVGKLLLGLRVVRESGQTAGIGWCALRWILLAVDLFCCMLGVVLMVTTKGHRRIGDMAANTFVVTVKDAGEPIVVPGVNAPELAPMAPPAPTARPTTSEGPIWDEARDTYIQFDRGTDAWVEWDADERSWVPITRGDRPSEDDAPGDAP